MIVGRQHKAECLQCGTTIYLASARDAELWLIRHVESAHGRAVVDRRDDAVKEAVDKELARWNRAPSIDPFGRPPVPIRSYDKADEEHADTVKRVK